MSFNLKSAVPTEADLAHRTTWVEFKGIRFQIRYISRATLLHLGEQCRVLAWDAKARTRTQSLDADKFIDLIATTIVQGWDRCTPANLSKVMPINTTGVDKEDLENPIEFNKENLLLVVKNVHELDNFLQDCATDASAFRPVEDEELTKNSQTSQNTP